LEFQQNSKMTTIATIIIVEENEELLTLEQLHLLKEEFDVIELKSIKKVENFLDKSHLLVLDRELSAIDGADFIEYLREKGFDIPIILVSNKDSENDIEQAFIAGCDDYIIKPIKTKELICRIKSILKRTLRLQHGKLSYRDITLDINTRQCYVDGKVVELTKLEFDLLNFFIKNRNSILERDYILEKVWNNTDTKKRTVNVRINRLIKKIDPDNTKNYFTAIRGIGYKFG